MRQGKSMDIAELLDAAKRKQGSNAAVAEKLGYHYTKLSHWRSGRYKPDATEIMLLAEMAGLPAFETLAEIESQINSERASVWQRALGNLRAAGVAATVVLGATAVVSLTSKPADAAEKAQEKQAVGAPGWDRTSNPCLRRAVLYPLSYGRLRRSAAALIK